MNKEYVLYNLKEALEELSRTISGLENDKTFDIGDFWPAMQHLYHHINTAWNARESTDEESSICSQSNFEKWRQFPSDLYMGV